VGTTAEVHNQGHLGSNFFSGPEKQAMYQRLKQFVVRFQTQEDGPTAVEYAVMLALIIVVCIGAITILGNNANTTFGSVGTTIGSGS
jgi:pilus assembly protein Flp/PilA